ncbi:beta-1,3-glucan-binding protein-like [Chironomus tepperi]|uniref:beta-1,3-glucan-binding protein-like n=1 Tax=Chironomus tepperi TaxID=113505 RepID=UPI00391FABDA
MKIAVLCVLVCAFGISNGCVPSFTKVSGTAAPRTFCSGDVIFEDNFNCLNHQKWFFENTLAGGGNWEFQWYPGFDAENIFAEDGVLKFRPTFTSDRFGEAFLTQGRVSIPPDQCSQADWYGCDRTGNDNNIINPIRSIRVDTRKSFSFVYGELEIRAKMPAGDWLWPALWLMPEANFYGGWPRSGEIDLLETRGNRNLFDGSTNVGVEQGGSTMHFGPNWNHNGWPTAHRTRNQQPGYDAGFHNYTLRWEPTRITFLYDGEVVNTVDAGTGFWDRGNFHDSGFANPWANGTVLAPFDQEFYIIMNLAVGGVNFFPDHFVNRNNPKPWNNGSPTALRDFWRGRAGWEPTWNLGTEDSFMQIDHVRVRAL